MAQAMTRFDSAEAESATIIDFKTRQHLSADDVAARRAKQALALQIAVVKLLREFKCQTQATLHIA
jgi:hypothetical protein